MEKTFGVQYFEPVCKAECSKVEDWSWTPTKNARLDLLKESMTFPGTTGTGPLAQGDERPEES